MKYYNQQEVAQRIKRARIVAGLTQKKLAEILNLTENSIYRMESGKWGHSVDRLVETAQVLQTSLDHLLLGDESER